MSKKKEKKLELLSSRIDDLFEGIEATKCCDYELNGKKGYVQGYLACMYDLKLIDKEDLKKKHREADRTALLSSIKNNPKLAPKLAEFDLANRCL